MYTMVYADEQGRFYDQPSLLALGRSGDVFTALEEEDMMELPAGASLVSIPQGHPAGLSKTGKFRLWEQDAWGKPAYALGALLPQGYTRTLLPAYRRKKKDKSLPLFGYAAVAWHKGKLYVAARKTDEPKYWDPQYYNTPELPQMVAKAQLQMPHNRIVKQLAHCALQYQCFTAQNIFYRHWEGGIPVSPRCNARCMGCISLQPAECCPAPQSRIQFTPLQEEVAEIAVPHLNGSPEAIISFGQGCEGEPALSPIVPSAVRMIRQATKEGTLNMNTNAGFTKGIVAACDAGLDSLRVSLISAREEAYNAYYRPKDYSLHQVKQSIAYARAQGIFVSINLLLFPGFTDREEEMDALLAMLFQYNINMVQMRNLNIDPDTFLASMPKARGECVGVGGLLEGLQQIPKIKVGNFSHPVK